MKTLLSALVLMALVSTAEATWFEKPVQCSTGEDVYNTLIEPNDLQPMLVAVASIVTPDDSTPAVLIFYINIDTGRFLILEADNVSTCIIGIGDGVDVNISPEEIKELLLKNSGLEG